MAAAKALRNKAVERLMVLAPDEMSPADVIRALQVAAEMERKAVGLKDGLEIERTGQVDMSERSSVTQRILQDPELRKRSLDLFEEAYDSRPRQRPRNASRFS